MGLIQRWREYWRDRRLLKLRAKIGKKHDYTSSSWGHAIHDHHEHGVFDVHQIQGHGRGVRVGDAIVRSGEKHPRLLYYVLEIEYYRDPRDMFGATVQYVGVEDGDDKTNH